MDRGTNNQITTIVLKAFLTFKCLNVVCSDKYHF